MNVASWLTLSRVVLVPVFMVLLLERWTYGAPIAAAVFILAAITDGLDGALARRRNEVTNFGRLMDPLADKLMVTAALVTLVETGDVAAWVAVVIVGREFAVSGLRMVSAAQGRVISAARLGKWKTFSQVVAVVALILDVFPAGWLLAVAVILTIVSGAEYFWKNQDVFREGGTMA